MVGEGDSPSWVILEGTGRGEGLLHKGDKLINNFEVGFKSASSNGVNNY